MRIIRTIFEVPAANQVRAGAVSVGVERRPGIGVLEVGRCSGWRAARRS